MADRDQQARHLARALGIRAQLSGETAHLVGRTVSVQVAQDRVQQAGIGGLGRALGGHRALSAFCKQASKAAWMRLKAVYRAPSDRPSRWAISSKLASSW